MCGTKKRRNIIVPDVANKNFWPIELNKKLVKDQMISSYFYLIIVKKDLRFYFVGLLKTNS